jgi:uncharacterized protein (DUF433 family)
MTRDDGGDRESDRSPGKLGLGRGGRPGLRFDAAEPVDRSRDDAYEGLAEDLNDELRPEGRMESLLTGRIVLAAWKLVDGGRPERWIADLDRSTRILSRWRRFRRNRRRVGDEPVAPEPESLDWCDRLTFDPGVSDASPVVRGTWITVDQVVGRIVDGWSWSDVLRAHPELVEDDLRACLAYAVEE